MRSRFRYLVLPLSALPLATLPGRAPDSVTVEPRMSVARGGSVDNPQTPGLVPLTIFANVGGKPLTVRHEGECKHAPVAAAYGVRSAMWTARFSGPPDGEIHNLYLTMWRPLAGGAPDQFSLALRTGGVDYLIDTVKGSRLRGRGTIQFKPNNAGGGGQFELHGRAADSTDIRVRLYCPSFTTLQPVGG